MFDTVNKKSYIFGLLVVVIIVTVFFLIRASAPKTSNTKETAAQIRQELSAIGMRIEGTVVAVSDTTITIKTQVGDIDTIEESVLKGIPLQFSDREITVNLSPDTSYIGFMKNEITTGLIVKVALSASIYETDHLTALSIERFDLKTQVIKEVTQRDMIAGGVLSVSGKTLIIETEVADEEKLKNLDMSSGSVTVPYVAKAYTVTITDSTEFMEGVTMDDIVLGTQISVWGEGNLYTTDAFDATKIYLIPE